jgi:hypothetical protein
VYFIDKNVHLNDVLNKYKLTPSLMKNITINPNSKVAKTARFTFNYLHLIIILAVLLMFNVESAHSQSAGRAAAPEAVVETDSSVFEAPSNPAVNAVSYAAYSKGKSVVVNASKLMVAIAVYDLSGRCVYSVNGISTRDYKTPPIDLPRQVLVVKAHFENDTTASRNIVLN